MIKMLLSTSRYMMTTESKPILDSLSVVGEYLKTQPDSIEKFTAIAAFAFAVDEIRRTTPGWVNINSDHIWHNPNLGLYTFSNEASQFEGYYTTYEKAFKAFVDYRP